MRPRHYHLAQLNIARMRAPLDSPVMADFVSQVPAVNALADHAEGFVWRLEEATAVRPYDDPLILINLSVWESVETLRAFAYLSGHAGPFRERARWFERLQEAHQVLWWIPAGHIPGVREAVDRLHFRRRHGDSPVAFSFGASYPQPDAPEAAPAEPAVNLDNRVFVSAANTPNGDADRETRFYYRQQGGRVWATYAGGKVRFGSLVAVTDDQGWLDMRYHHVDLANALRTGTCMATTTWCADGRIAIIEDWQWTNGDHSAGRSMLEELRV